MSRFRILIVENDEGACDQLWALLSDGIPDSQVDHFQDVASATNGIRRLAESGGQYDLAILDFKLPATPGEAEKGDTSLSALFAKLMPETVICHMSGYMTDPDVQRGLENADSPHAAVFRFDKIEDPPGELLKRAKQALYGRLIEREMAALAPQRGQEHLRGRQDLTTSCSTIALEQLRADVSQYWDDLHETLQARLAERFGIERLGDGSVKAYMK